MDAVGDLDSRTETRIFGNSDELATHLAEYIAQLSETYVKERGVFTIALSGGPVISLIRELCKGPYDKIVDWTKWYIFWVDECVVAKNHVDSNYKLAKDGFLSKVPVLGSHIYSINDNLTAEDAATEYGFAIRQLVKIRTINVSEHNDCPKFDLVLLYMESDGHVASLFPNHPVLDQKLDWVTYITDAPKPPPERITFTLPVINSASNVAIMAIGEDKASAVHRSVSGIVADASSVPARKIRPTDGTLVWFLDKFAASKLDTTENGSYQHHQWMQS